MKLLLERPGVDVVNSKDIWKRTPLSYAAESGHGVVVKLLLEKLGVDVGSNDVMGRTLLSYAAKSRYEAVVKLLLEKPDIDVTLRDDW